MSWIFVKFLNFFHLFFCVILNSFLHRLVQDYRLRSVKSTHRQDAQTIKEKPNWKVFSGVKTSHPPKLLAQRKLFLAKTRLKTKRKKNFLIAMLSFSSVFLIKKLFLRVPEKILAFFLYFADSLAFCFLLLQTEKKFLLMDFFLCLITFCVDRRSGTAELICILQCKKKKNFFFTLRPEFFYLILSRRRSRKKFLNILYHFFTGLFSSLWLRENCVFFSLINFLTKSLLCSRLRSLLFFIQ